MRNKRIQKRREAAAKANANATPEYAPDLFGKDIEGNEDMSELVEAEHERQYECPCCTERSDDWWFQDYERWYLETKQEKR